MMKLHSKKGVTMVELIICIALFSVIIMAAYAVFGAGSSSYRSTEHTVIDYLNFNSVEQLLENTARFASGVRIVYFDKASEVQAAMQDGEIAIYMDGGKFRYCAKSGNASSIDNIEKFTFYFKPLGIGSGEGDPFVNPAALTAFAYTVTTAEGSYPGNIVMNNVHFFTSVLDISGLDEHTSPDSAADLSDKIAVIFNLRDLPEPAETE